MKTNGKATKHIHIAEATQQIEEQHMRILSLNSQKMVVTLYEGHHETYIKL